MAFTLIINPLSDDEFGAFVRERARGASDPATLQAALRERYPRAVARLRELAGEDRTVWYVYREGRWIPSENKDEGGA